MFKINQRRYLGNKTKVLDLIKKVIDENIKDFFLFVIFLQEPEV